MNSRFFAAACWMVLWTGLSPCVAWSAPSAGEASALLRGKVIDSLTRLPVASAQVIAGTHVVETDAEGRFVLDAPTPELVVRRPGYLRTRVTSAEAGEVVLEPFVPRALYLSFYGAGYGPLRQAALDLIEQTELNAVVIDVKGDRGFLSYPSQLFQAHDVGAQEVITLRQLDRLVASLRDRGIYTIARVVVFKDDRLARSCPTLAIDDGTGRPYVDREQLVWADPFQRAVWEYNIGVAEEAARLGFDEIQFDYVRFPAQGGLRFSQESTRRSRVAAISGFLAEARRRLLPYGVYISADIFGYVCWQRDDMGIGQELNALAPHVDYLAPMLYPSGFSQGIPEYRNPVEAPYEIIYLSLEEAYYRTGLEPVRFRPWLQAFRDYAFDRRKFGAVEIRAQIEASRDFGANGYMLWNAANIYSSAGLVPLHEDVAQESAPPGDDETLPLPDASES